MKLRSPFSDYERTFILRMSRLQKEGYDFQGGSRMALEAKFGGAADVLLRGLGDQALQDPALFVGGLARTFGRGSAGFLEPVIRWADRDLFPRAKQPVTLHEAIAKKLPLGNGTEEERMTPLHEQRIRDDEGKISDEYD